MKLSRASGMAVAACLYAGAAWAVPNPQDPFLAPVSVTPPAAAGLLVAPTPPQFQRLIVPTGASSANLFAIIPGGAWTKADFDPATVTLTTAVTGQATWTTSNGGVLTLGGGVLTYRASTTFTGTDTFNMALDAQVLFGTTAVDNWSQIFTASVIVPPSPTTGNVIRFSNPADGSHFYTSNPTEVGQIANSAPFLVNEGVAFKGLVPPPGTPTVFGMSQVYRFFQRTTGLHLFTSNPAEINLYVMQAPSNTTTNYVTESIPFYVYNAPGVGVPVFRLYNMVTGDHLLTTSVGERATLLSAVPRVFADEGIAFWGAP